LKSIVGAVYDRAYFVDLGRMNGERHSPPSIGGVDATSRRSREASFDGADGVVKDGTSSKERILKEFGNPNHPVCAAKVASHLFLDGAATSPDTGGELPGSDSFTPSLIAPTVRTDALRAPSTYESYFELKDTS
jgi:hypothetical protein